MAAGDNLTLSTLRGTVHLGAHADAPSHYGADAPSIDQVDLTRYVGLCQVMRVRVEGRSRLSLDALTDTVRATRLLIATGTYPNPEQFAEDFVGLDPELVNALADRGVTLVGVDTPSVDLFNSKDLPAHHACLRRGVSILEGLTLDGVPEGMYELIALPLKLVGFDASPVRAVLRAPT
jgi:arylformamidase